VSEDLPDLVLHAAVREVGAPLRSLGCDVVVSQGDDVAPELLCQRKGGGEGENVPLDEGQVVRECGAEGDELVGEHGEVLSELERVA